MRQLLVFVFVASVVSQEVKHDNFSKFLEPKESDVLSRAVVEVIINQYVNSTAVVNFAFSSSSTAGKRIIMKTIHEVFVAVDSKLTISIEDNNHMVKVNRKRKFNVFYVDGYESFTKINHNLSTEVYDFQGFYIIVVTQPENNIKGIFEDLWSLYITNANVVTLDSHNLNQVNVFTYFPFAGHHCEKVVPILYNTYTIEEGFKRNLPYFPKKTSNMHGCPLSVATFNFPPFITIERNDDESLTLSGLDGFLITLISELMNFTLIVVEVTDVNLWGSLYENGSSSGATGMVMDGIVNSTIGYYTLSPVKFQLLSASHAYYTSSLVWMVPPGSEFTSLSILTKPFELNLWTFVIAVFIISMLVVVLIKRCPLRIRNFVIGENVSSPGLNIINICLGGALVRTPNRNFARTLLCIFMLYCIIIRCSYQGGLFKFMRMDTKEPIAETFYKMIERNYLFYMRHTSIEHIQHFADILERSVFLDIEEANNCRFKLLDPNFKGTLLTSEDHTAYWNQLNHSKDFFHILESRLTTFNLCILFPKRTCLTPEVNNIILGLYANGLLNEIGSHFINKKYLIEPVTVPETNELDMNELAGGFQLLACGVFLCIGIFLLELLSKRFVIARRILNLFH
ncbi:unnamed protein product [Diamesa hyperborea]